MGGNSASPRSFVDVPAESHFPLQNLPYGVFTPAGETRPRVGVRIGDFVLDLSAVEEAGLFRETPLGTRRVFDRPALNAFLALGRGVWGPVRRRIGELLHTDCPRLRDDQALRARALVPVARVALHLPAEIGDFTDFYSSREHAANVGRMFRGTGQPLLPNYLWLPVAYHGRASSIVLSGAPIRRPSGQTQREPAPAPTFGPTRELDFELEVGFLVGPGNELGEPIPIAEAEQHIFGLVLVNDWSARDIQRWEYQPLGPFGSKNFATTISPWVVPLEALEPFRCAGPLQEPPPLDYLRPRGDERGGDIVGNSVSSGGGAAGWAYDIRLEAALRTRAMDRPHVICRTNFRYLYWSMVQQVAHHAATGCNLRPGDLLASGTISGTAPDAWGSLLELAWRGERPVRMPTGEERSFLEDGDEVTLTGWCAGEGYRVGFGECTGRVAG